MNALAEHRADPTARAGTQRIGAARHHRPTILVVDDDRVICRYLDLALGRGGAYAVEIANDVASALDILASTLVDLIISDVAMPGQDGFQFFRRMRRDQRFRALPFIVLSGDARVATKVGGLAMGIDDYLTKPVDLAELKARIDATLRRAEAARQANRARRYTLAGDFTGMPFPDLLALIGQGRRSGTLAIATARAGAELFFAGGQLLHAAYGNLVGADAVYRLMRDRDGRFEFAPGAPPADLARTVGASITALLMEGARRLDDEAAAGAGGKTDVIAKPPTVRRALSDPPSSPAAAEELAAAIADPFALGELLILDAAALGRWTAPGAHGDRVQALLVAAPESGIPALTALAGPVSEHELEVALAQPPLALALAFRLRDGRLVDVVLVPHDRIAEVQAALRGRPAAVIVAPPAGDLLDFGVPARVALDALLARCAGAALIACGNAALADEFAQARSAPGAGALRCLPGALGEPGCDLRALLQVAIALWGAAAGGLPGPAGAKAPTGSHDHGH